MERPTYQLFTIRDSKFTIGSRRMPIVAPDSRANPNPGIAIMKKQNETVRIELTPEQKQIVKKEIGKDAEAVELTVAELEERIAPVIAM